jgi:hypothetical protein
MKTARQARPDGLIMSDDLRRGRVARDARIIHASAAS